MNNGFYIDNEIIDLSIEKYGTEAQTRQVMEECAELIQATNKQLRGKRDDLHLAEEIADVAVCLRMLMRIYQIEYKDIQNWIGKKQRRLLYRIYEEDSKDGKE